MMPGDTAARTSFALPVRVYYEDTDAAGGVYYANYLRYLERARTEWLRALGYDQAALATERGIAFAVRALEIEYLKPARLDDRLDVVCAVDALGRARLTFDQRVEREGELLVVAKVHVACIDALRLKATAIPNDLLARFETLK
jgi:acyl-CoA thioester hydrolase